MKRFRQIRKFLLESKGLDAAKISAAEKLAQDDMIGIPAGMPGYSTLGDLYLRSLPGKALADYRRQLDLDTGVVRITYTAEQHPLSRAKSSPRHPMK